MFPPNCCPIPCEKLPQKVVSVLSFHEIYHQIEYTGFIAAPHFLGIHEFTTTISLSSFEEFAIFRFISLAGEILPWPSTFQMCVCGKWMKKPLNDKNLYHYLPEGFKLIGELAIRCGIESTPFLFTIQSAKSNQTLFFSIPLISDSVGLSTSPISGKKMLYPARSQFCRHNQCVEIDEYVAAIDRKQKCPLCDLPVTLSSTAIDSGLHIQALKDSLINQTKNDNSSISDGNDFF